jgi:hypothetical protein
MFAVLPAAGRGAIVITQFVTKTGYGIDKLASLCHPRSFTFDLTQNIKMSIGRQHQ